MITSITIPLDVPVVGMVAYLFIGIAFCLGLFLALALVLVVALVEALVLWGLFGWETLFRTWRQTFWANLVSAAAGVPLSLVMQEMMLTWWGLAICAVLSVAIESGVLWLLNRKVALKRLLLGCAAANLASYILIALMLLIRYLALH
jgi:hypothetical protein